MCLLWHQVLAINGLQANINHNFPRDYLSYECATLEFVNIGFNFAQKLLRDRNLLSNSFSNFNYM